MSGAFLYVQEMISFLLNAWLVRACSFVLLPGRTVSRSPYAKSHFLLRNPRFGRTRYPTPTLSSATTVTLGVSCTRHIFAMDLHLRCFGYISHMSIYYILGTYLRLSGPGRWDTALLVLGHLLR